MPQKEPQSDSDSEPWQISLSPLSSQAAFYASPQDRTQIQELILKEPKLRVLPPLREIRIGDVGEGDRAKELWSWGFVGFFQSP